MPRTAVYRLYNEADRLLYVGVAYDPEARWKNHANFSLWWPDVSRRDVEWHDNREAAECAERRAILTEGPLHNIAHTRGLRVPSCMGWWDYVMEVTNFASQSEIARRVGISQPSVSQWRSSSPKDTTIRAFAEAYDVPVIWAFIAAGWLTEEEAREGICARASTDELLAEVECRNASH